MAYAVTIGPWQFVSLYGTFNQRHLSCAEARKGCLPSFVFSISGQVRFRAALQHLSQCHEPQCSALRMKILSSMRWKLGWLLKEGCMLGCIHVQPLLYGAVQVRLSADDFEPVAYHLAHCPKENCSKLRRSLLLTIRNGLRVMTEPKSLR